VQIGWMMLNRWTQMQLDDTSSWNYRF